MISCTTYNRNTFQKIDILDIKGGDIMDTLKKLQYIAEDIRKSYDIPHLYNRVEVLHAAEIKEIIKKLDSAKAIIDIEYKFKDMPKNISIFRQMLVRLILDNQDLYKNVLNKSNALIRKYNSYILDTLNAIN